MIDPEDVDGGWYWVRDKKDHDMVVVMVSFELDGKWLVDFSGSDIPWSQDMLVRNYDIIARIEPPAWAASEFIESRDSDAA